MPCQEISPWTFDGLVAAFLDLAIAYFLLCASALVYLASKFLGLFGSNLPCPCDGLFSDPNKKTCLQEILGNFPVEMISSVQGSVKSKIPFDKALENDPRFRHPAKEKRSETCNEQVLRNEIGANFDPLSSQSLRVGSSEIKCMRFGVHRPRYNLRHRRKGTLGRGKFSSVPIHDHLLSDTCVFLQSPASVTKMRNDTSEEETIHVMLEDEEKALEDVARHEGVSHGSELDERSYEIKPSERISSGEMEINVASPLDLGFDGNARNAIRMLEQALEEEQAACAALCLELEKERNAAATAADEAMAMILRLQGEKASIEMEAKQYQRMVEAKSAFDAEEMNILKEILIRRETEKHFLEKEVEAYRQMLSENEQSETDLLNMEASQKDKELSLYPNKDSEQISHQMGGSRIALGKIETSNSFAESVVTSNRRGNCVLTFGKELAVPEFEADVESLKLGEVHQNPVDDNPASEESELNSLEQTSKLNPTTTQEKTIIPEQEKQEEIDKRNQCPTLSSKTNQSCNEAKVITQYIDNVIGKHKEDCDGSCVDVNCHMHDIHVIGDEVNVRNKVNGSKTHQLQMNVPYSFSKSYDVVSPTRQDFMLDRSRSVLDTAHGLSLLCCPQGKTSVFDMRRKSMSAVDYERLKLENEVGWLRGRLRVVQQGREKLSFSVGHRENDKTQMQCLEDITSQLHEIQQFASAGKPLRQDSLPPLLSKVKVMSKKRRWRSAALDLHSA